VDLEHHLAKTVLILGVFFLSLAAIFMDETFHIQSAYLELDPTGRMLNNAIGLYLSGWLILTTLLLICTVRSTLPLFSTVLCLDLLFVLLTAGYMSGSTSVMRGAGGVALATAILGFYNSFAGVATKENSWIAQAAFHARSTAARRSRS
jgi:succinate-acetate transporter protein